MIDSVVDGHSPSNVTSTAIRDQDSHPFYVAQGGEEAVFRSAHESRLPILLKGPTGSGKTRFVEHMADVLGVELITVACHEDLTAADLVGRHLLEGGDTVWVDGPLTKAVRRDAICYLDEVVEARQDTTVVLHPLADHRRELHIDRLGEILRAGPKFGLVVSYNPGYQSILKDLKDSTRQRMVAIELGFPVYEVEVAVLRHETGIDEAMAGKLVDLAGAIRSVRDAGLREAASTRTLVAAGLLIQNGLEPVEAGIAAIAGPLTDDVPLSAGLRELVTTYLG